MYKSQPDIAIFLRNLTGGGAERVMLNLASGFQKKGANVEIILTNAEGRFLDQVPKEIKVISFDNRNLYGSNLYGKFKLTTGFQSLRSLPKLVNYLGEKKPKVLLSATHFTNEIAILAKKISGVSTPIFVSEHTNISVEAKLVEQKSSRLVPLTARLLYPFADGIVAVSQGAADSLAGITKIASEKVDVIYNPVLTPELRVKMMESIEHPWLETNEVPVVIGAGRFVAQKDFSTLIRAFAKVRQVRPAKLMMLGSGRDEKKLKALVKELNIEEYVAWEGFVSNPFAYMKQAAVFVLSSLWEGLPTILIEALAVGIPVVATDCPSGPSEILANGKYGELVPVGNSEAIASAILRVLSGDVKSVDSDWLEQFTWETSTQRYLDFLGISDR
ncbi:MAG: glycosyltransferase [Okeania sp. SIO3I5]|uniref:glycosyltransferase n=1 Tax=Okeania sp. SIO3I5 TaxID=2607805 RepID=UPI0013B7CE3F|nr:glycosyltransferase [Okeania sp. SIO3I5]NEQ41002.1 glycosyltransferase [Okeania sp. SIO3I5]